MSLYKNNITYDSFSNLKVKNIGSKHNTLLLCKGLLTFIKIHYELHITFKTAIRIFDRRMEPRPHK